jgi:hypothetical protein
VALHDTTCHQNYLLTRHTTVGKYLVEVRLAKVKSVAIRPNMHTKSLGDRKPFLPNAFLPIKLTRLCCVHFGSLLLLVACCLLLVPDCHQIFNWLQEQRTLSYSFNKHITITITHSFSCTVLSYQRGYSHTNPLTHSLTHTHTLTHSLAEDNEITSSAAVEFSKKC